MHFLERPHEAEGLLNDSTGFLEENAVLDKSAECYKSAFANVHSAFNVSSTATINTLVTLIHGFVANVLDFAWISHSNCAAVAVAVAEMAAASSADCGSTSACASELPHRSNTAKLRFAAKASASAESAADATRPRASLTCCSSSWAWRVARACPTAIPRASDRFEPS